MSIWVRDRKCGHLHRETSSVTGNMGDLTFSSDDTLTASVPTAKYFYAVKSVRNSFGNLQVS